MTIAPASDPAEAPATADAPAGDPADGRATADAPATGLSAQETADRLLDATSRLRRAARRRARRPPELARLTGAQLELVRLVRRRPRVSVAEAAQELALAANTVSTLVRQLTEAGLLKRQADENDRRVARLELTPEISHKVDAVRDRRVVSLTHAIDLLSAGEQRELARAAPLLTRVAQQLESLGGGR